MPDWNLGYLKDQVKKRVQSDILYSDNDVVDALNSGQDQLILFLGDDFEDVYEAVTQGGVSEYKLPGELIQIHGADYNGNPLTSRTLVEARGLGYLNPNNDNTGVPSDYYFRMDGTGMFIGLGPTPSASDDTMTIYYARKPDDMVDDTDVPAVPAAFGRAMIHFAVAELLEMDVDSEGSEAIAQRVVYHRRRFENYRDDAGQYFGMNNKRKVQRTRRR